MVNPTDATIVAVRSDADKDAVREMVWELFDVFRERYPDMVQEIQEYIEHQDVVGQLRDYDSHFLPPVGDCFLARGADGTPLGICMLRPHPEGGELNRMYVREAARGLGLGRKLGEAVIIEARRLGYGIVWLDALYRHVEALPLYESLGFERYTDPNALHGNDERVIHMKLTLK